MTKYTPNRQQNLKRTTAYAKGMLALTLKKTGATSSHLHSIDGSQSGHGTRPPVVYLAKKIVFLPMKTSQVQGKIENLNQRN